MIGTQGKVYELFSKIFRFNIFRIIKLGSFAASIFNKSKLKGAPDFLPLKLINRNRQFMGVTL